MIKSLLFAFLGMLSFFSSEPRSNSISHEKTVTHESGINNKDSQDQNIAKESEKSKLPYFFIIMPVYNVSSFCEKTLLSFLQQTNQNFQLFIIDDGSTDDSFIKMKHFLQKHPSSHIELIHKKQSKGSLERFYEVIYSLSNDSLVLYLENKTALAHEKVLENLAHLFKDEKIWMAYGQHLNVKNQQPSHCPPLFAKNFFTHSARGKFFKSPQCKIFYAGLFKRIKTQELFFRGECVGDGFDEAYMFPMAEMAEGHIAYIKDILVDYFPSVSPLKKPSDNSWIRCRKYLRKFSPSSPLACHPKEPLNLVNNKTDLMIFSYDRPIQLYALLESLQLYVVGLNKVSVIYRTSNNRMTTAYENLKHQFPLVQFIQQSENPHGDFQPLVLQTTFSSAKDSGDYIIFAVDDLIVKDFVFLPSCIDALEQTKAYFFSLRLGKHITYCYMGDSFEKIPHHLTLNPSILCWDIDSAQGDWMYRDSVDMTIYRKADIKKALESTVYKTPNELEIAWSKFDDKDKKKRHIGLAFFESKAVNLPLNLVNLSQNRNTNLYSSMDLLLKYEQGLKIDIHPLFRVANVSVHMDYVPAFVPR
jgi:hypothetical protein